MPAEFGGLDVDLRKAIFRIAQEAVTNVAKHAQAHQVRVQVGVSPEEASVEITDDGVGVPEADGDLLERGFGLRGMAERARAAGGTLNVERLAGGGTRVLARLPRMTCRAD